jgi:hypothetical protein
MSASKKPVRARRAKSRKPAKAPKVLPDLQEILGAFSDATDFVKVVYAAFESNGRDGPEQSVLCQAVKDLDNAYEKLAAAAHEIEKYRGWKSRAVRGAS